MRHRFYSSGGQENVIGDVMAGGSMIG